MIAAIICEYNPFHIGHSYQINEIRKMLGEDTIILSLMSGSTVQRGDVAVASKYHRAMAAIEMGSDLVLELPYPYSSLVAEQFALSAVSILDRLCIVDHLVFGSESGNIGSLAMHAKRRADSAFEDRLCEMRRTQKDISYPRLVEQCYFQMYGENFPKGANDILGVFYIKALCELGSKIEPLTHLRLPDSSATRARREMAEGKYTVIPSEVQSCFLTPPATLARAERLVLYSLRNGNDPELRNAALNAVDYRDLMQKLSDKNCTDARIRRSILHGVIGYDDTDFVLPSFTNVLAMNQNGAALLHKMKKTSAIPIITKPADYTRFPEIISQFERNLRADSLFSLTTSKILPANWSLKATPYVKK